jgi:cytochrome c-type biogenesis protein CcmH
VKGRALLAALAGALCLAGASDPAERLSDPAQEARARHLMQQVRCVVCQNESIDDSDADIAADLRRIVREEVKAGRSDEQIKAFLVDRYGDFVLLRPPFSPAAAALWLTPFLVLLGAGAVLLLRIRRPGPESEPELSEDEEAALQALTNGGRDSHGSA